MHPMLQALPFHLNPPQQLLLPSVCKLCPVPASRRCFCGHGPHDVGQQQCCMHEVTDRRCAQQTCRSGATSQDSWQARTRVGAPGGRRSAMPAWRRSLRWSARPLRRALPYAPTCSAASTCCRPLQRPPTLPSLPLAGPYHTLAHACQACMVACLLFCCPPPPCALLDAPSGCGLPDCPLALRIHDWSSSRPGSHCRLSCMRRQQQQQGPSTWL